MEAITIALKDEQATAALGMRLAGVLALGDVLCLSGDLGAGKTTLARGLIKTAAGAAEAPSPTYTFVETYETDRFMLWHFDLYRLERPEDVWELGFEEALEDGAVLIEWPERIGALAPPGALTIRLEIDRAARRAVIDADESWRRRLSAAGIA